MWTLYSQLRRQKILKSKFHCFVFFNFGLDPHDISLTHKDKSICCSLLQCENCDDVKCHLSSNYCMSKSNKSKAPVGGQKTWFLGLFPTLGIISKLVVSWISEEEQVFSSQELVFNHVLFSQSLSDVCVCVCMHVWRFMSECTVYTAQACIFMCMRTWVC